MDTFNFDSVVIKLAGNQDSHKILDEFEFRPHLTINFEVNLEQVRFPARSDYSL